MHSAPGDASNRGLSEDMVSHLVRTLEPGASYQRNEASGRLSVVTGVRVSTIIPVIDTIIIMASSAGDCPWL